MDKLTKEQLEKIKEELTKVLGVLYTVMIDYQTRLKHCEDMIKGLQAPEVPTVNVTEKPAESKKS